MDNIQLYVFLGAGALIAVVVWLAVRAAKRRRAALETLAVQNGWSFSADAISADALDAGPFPLFERGRSQKAQNVMRGSSGETKFMVFDYRYTTGSGKSSSTTHQTVAHVRSRRLALPPFVLSPENVFHKIGGLFGYHDIDFDASPEFSSRYLLRSKESEPYVRDLFSPSVRGYFERHDGLTVEGHADSILVYRHGRTGKPEQMRAFVDAAQEIARLFER